MSDTFARPWRLLAIAAITLVFPMRAGSADDFYKNKTVRIIVGYGPGGGYDFYARRLAQYMGRYIPGHPAVVVENMPGAGSVNAANYVFAVAPKDGTVIAAVDFTTPTQQSPAIARNRRGIGIARRFAMARQPDAFEFGRVYLVYERHRHDRRRQATRSQHGRQRHDR